MRKIRSHQLKDVLKDLLKQKGLTYEDLARELECSLPTVKRILGPEEITLSRLLRICDLLEIDLAHLQALMEGKKEEEERYTKEQESFLVKNKMHFAYLMKLFSGESPKKIAEKFSLTQRSTDRYLIALERAGLIHVTGKQKVKPAFKQMPRLRNGPLGKMYFETLIRNAGAFFIESIREEMLKAPEADNLDKGFGILAQKITRETYKNWTSEKQKLRHHFSKIAEFEEKTKPDSELMTIVEVEGWTLIANDHPHLNILEESFGSIQNL